ncbi:MAG: putative DNA binding domain-containing protein [Ignavibacteriales bacterium]|nr:putative DNA binding domain-containing protein [Ignavibacteriales bacterium]
MQKALSDLLAQGETENTEFKAFADSRVIAETVCAFLNAGGGTLLVGVGDKGKVRGVPQAEEQAANILRRLYVDISPKTIWSVTVENGGVIMIGVPSGKDKPYTFNGRIFVREGAATQEANSDAIRKMVEAQLQEPMRWERLFAQGLEPDSLNEEQIRQTALDGTNFRGCRFQDLKNVSIILEDLSLQRGGTLTNAADVLFNKNPNRRLPQTRVRATVFPTDKGGKYTDDRLFEGNALELFNNLQSFLRQYVSIEVDFPRGKSERKEKPKYPFTALDEALVNAFVHRDYSQFSGGMSVGVYPTRIEIWNSGGLPEGLSISDLRRRHPSKPNNPDIAHVFYLRRLMERVGRGTQKIIDEFKAAGLPAPVWESSPTGVTLILKSKATKDKVALNARQLSLIAKLRSGDSIEPKNYYSQMSSEITQRQAQRDLARLAAGGWLRRVGTARSTIYIRTDKE